MRTLFSRVRAAMLGVAFVFTALALPACANLGLGGGDEPNVSPRWAVFKAADTVEPVITEVTAMLAAGVISDNVADDIAEHGPTIQRIIAAYFDGAEACVVNAGALVTEAGSTRECEKSTLLALYKSLDGEIIAWMLSASAAGDTDAAATIGAARLVISLVPKPVAGGGSFTGGPGYRDEPDVPLSLFQARRASLKADFELMLAAAAARAGK